MTTKLEGVVYNAPGGSVIHTDTLASGGPVSCCTTPSAGFSYTGTEYLDVSAGNSFGFKVYGSNGDLNSRLIGDLKIAYNVVSNPSFELGNLTTSQELHRLAPGSTAMPFWTVEDRGLPTNTSEVDWTGEWPAPDGFRSVDLDGAPSAGGIRQDVATIPGRRTPCRSSTPETLIASWLRCPTSAPPTRIPPWNPPPTGTAMS